MAEERNVADLIQVVHLSDGHVGIYYGGFHFNLVNIKGFTGSSRTWAQGLGLSNRGDPPTYEKGRDPGVCWVTFFPGCGFPGGR